MSEREKIISIIRPIIKDRFLLYCHEAKDCTNCDTDCKVNLAAKDFADALIAAGIGDVEKAKKEVNYWKSEVKTARVDIDDAVKEITEIIFTELRDYFVEQSAYAADCNQHTGYYDYEIKASDVVCDIVTIAEKYGVELGAKDDD